jgi:hypothetical protein
MSPAPAGEPGFYWVLFSRWMVAEYVSGRGETWWSLPGVAVRCQESESDEIGPRVERPRE